MRFENCTRFLCFHSEVPDYIKRFYKYKVQKHAWMFLSAQTALWVSTFWRVMSVGLNTRPQSKSYLTLIVKLSPSLARLHLNTNLAQLSKMAFQNAFFKSSINAMLFHGNHFRIYSLNWVFFIWKFCCHPSGWKIRKLAPALQRYNPLLDFWLI